MSTGAKAAVIIGALAAILGVGSYVYVSRPVAMPSGNIEEAAVSLPDGDRATHFRIAQEDSSVSFHVGEILAGEPFTTVGTTNQVAGEIALDPANPSAAEVSTILINARTITTDSPQRDGAIARFILQSEKDAHEFIAFMPTDINGLPSSILDDEPFSFTLAGNLTIAGVAKPATFTGTATLSGATLTVRAEATVTRSDFNLIIPNVPFVASVDNEVRLTADITAYRVQ